MQYKQLKILSKLRQWIIVASIASHLLLANAFADDLTSTRQSVLKSTDDNEITIQLDNQLLETTQAKKHINS